MKARAPQPLTSRPRGRPLLTGHARAQEALSEEHLHRPTIRARAAAAIRLVVSVLPSTLILSNMWLERDPAPAIYICLPASTSADTYG